MKKNTFKTLFLSFLAVSALFVLAACSSPKKAYFQLIDQNTKQDSRITVEYKGDELLINETNNTFYYKPVGLTKDTAKEQTEAYAKSIEGIKGLTHKIEYKDDYLTEKLTIDFSKADIDSFFTASGKSYFQHRIIVATTDHWTEHAYDSLSHQNPPVTVIDRSALENSAIDWDNFAFQKELPLKPKKSLREHQKNALSAVRNGLKNADRGKLIMACGTGKTFTSLKIAENIAGNGKKVLFLVPSLALLSQSLTEWTQESEYPLHCFAVCSDSDVGKKGKVKNEDDRVQQLNHELQYPATTNANSLIKAINAQSRDLLINLQPQLPEYINSFNQIIDFVPVEERPKALARERYKQLRQLGWTLSTEQV